MEYNRAVAKFMEGTVPNLTRAIEGLTKKLDQAFMTKADKELDEALLDLDREDELRHYIRETISTWQEHWEGGVPIEEAVASISGVYTVLGMEKEHGGITESEAAAVGDAQIL